MSGKSFSIRDVREIARGKDWVKFLVSFAGEKSEFAHILFEHDMWVVSGAADGFGCGVAEVMRFNFDDKKTVFKFKTEPYSMKSNDCFRYIRAFETQRSLETDHRGPGVSGTTFLTVVPEAEHGIETRSFLSRFRGII